MRSHLEADSKPYHHQSKSPMNFYLWFDLEGTSKEKNTFIGALSTRTILVGRKVMTLSENDLTCFDCPQRLFHPHHQQNLHAYFDEDLPPLLLLASS